MAMSVKQIADFFADNGLLPIEEFDKKLEKFELVDLDNMRDFIQIHCSLSKMSFAAGFKQGYIEGAEDFMSRMKDKYEV